MEKETKDKRFEVRLTAKELHKLQLRADLYSEGNISKLIRYWIEEAPVKFLERRKPLKQQPNQHGNNY
jgi:hypothetical protein